MKSLLFVLLCICIITLPYSSYSQKREFSGYYINKKGETIKGFFPRYTEWNRNPDHVDFISSTGPVILTPVTCEKFVVDSYDEYISYAGQRQLNPVDDDEVLKMGGLNIQSDINENILSFLRLVTRNSSCELYVYTDAKRKNFFYRIPGQGIVELKNKKYYNENRINESFEYKQQLHNLFGDLIDQKKLYSVLENLPFQENEISTFLQKLFISESKLRNKKADEGFVFFAGMAMNNIHVASSDQNFDSAPSDYNNSYSPLLSIGYYLPLDRNFGRYFVFPQLKLTTYKNYGEQNLGLTFIKSTTYKTGLVSTLEMNGGANFINNNQLKVFLSGGLGLMYQMDGQEIQQLYAASNHAKYGGPSVIGLMPFTYSINMGGGVIINKKLIILLKNLFPSPIMNMIYYDPRSSGLQLQIGYKLK